MSEALLEHFSAALATRKPLFAIWHAENTDCYRLFHGATEGRPGLTVDRYGPQLLIQTWRSPIAEAEFHAIVEESTPLFPVAPHVVYNHRGNDIPPWHYPLAEALAPAVCTELGVKYRVLGRHKGQDPLLFLDFRAARRWLLANAAGKSVLNTFAYTCGAGVAASVGGARSVWNVDFARFATDVGADNALLNDIVPRLPDGTARDEVAAETAPNDGDFRLLVENFYPVIKQLAGITLKGRGARSRRYLKLRPQRFDIVVLDPPRWAKTPWGAVDVVRDYASLFKPCVLTLEEGGAVLCTNHVPDVELTEWLGQLERCASKAGRPLTQIDVLEPEADFPSPDGPPPLKVAIVRI